MGKLSKEMQEAIREVEIVERYAGNKLFLAPDKPFLLMYQESMLGKSYYEWYDNEHELEERIKNLKHYESIFTDIEAIEIGSCRKIDVDKI